MKLDDAKMQSLDSVRYQASVPKPPMLRSRQCINDLKRQLIPVSACLDGQYGHSDVAIGVPAVIGKDGIHEIIELELDDAEKSVFDAGVTNVKNAIKSMDL